jgi:hypothetical protein
MRVAQAVLEADLELCRRSATESAVHRRGARTHGGDAHEIEMLRVLLVDVILDVAVVIGRRVYRQLENVILRIASASAPLGPRPVGAPCRSRALAPTREQQRKACSSAESGKCETRSGGSTCVTMSGSPSRRQRSLTRRGASEAYAGAAPARERPRRVHRRRHRGSRVSPTWFRESVA